MVAEDDEPKDVGGIVSIYFFILGIGVLTCFNIYLNTLDFLIEEMSPHTPQSTYSFAINGPLWLIQVVMVIWG
jgi:hypothetical protein